MKALFSLSSNLIPVMQFERDFMQFTGLTLDLTRFAFAFIAAVLSGMLVRWIRNPAGARAAQQPWQSCKRAVLLPSCSRVFKHIHSSTGPVKVLTCMNCREYQVTVVCYCCTLAVQLL